MDAPRLIGLGKSMKKRETDKDKYEGENGRK